MRDSKSVCVVYASEERSEVVGFGELDGKGRELGCSVRTSTLTAGHGPRAHRSYEHKGQVFARENMFSDETHSYYPAGETLDREPGVYFTASCHATRAGKPFGASQGRPVFASAEERDAWVA